MTSKSYTVFFAKTFFLIDSTEYQLKDKLSLLFEEHKEHLPVVKVEGCIFQVRDLKKVGRVWSGTFGRLRDDAPHIVDIEDREKIIKLDDEERVLDKCYFIYYESTNVLVWQNVRSVGGLSRFGDYFGNLLGVNFIVSYVNKDDELEKIMNGGQVYQMDFSYETQISDIQNPPTWNQKGFDMMKALGAGHGKFSFRAAKNGGLLDAAKQTVRDIFGQPGVSKITVKLTDEANPIELFSAPLKAKIKVDMVNGYPDKEKVFEELNEVYDIEIKKSEQG